MIREAEKKDTQAISELYRMLVPNSKKRMVLEDQIDKIRMDPNNFLLVFDEEGVILGTLTLNICLQALHGKSPYAIVENIVVHEDYIGKRVGQKLMQYVEEYCKSIDCHRIMLLSNSKRDNAHRFFEREGYDGTVSKGFKKYLK